MLQAITRDFAFIVPDDLTADNLLRAIRGSDKAAIERGIVQARQQGSPLTLPVSMEQTGDSVTVTVPASADGKGQAEIWLRPTTKSVPVAIGRGENTGQTITYSNVVRRWIKLGDWSGKAQTFSVPVKELQDGGTDSAVVMVQSGAASAPKAVLGAAQISVH